MKKKLLHFEHHPLKSKFPSGWALACLEEISEVITSGFPCGKHNASGNGIPHIRPMNIDREGRFDLNDVKYIEDDPPKNLQLGDVLFNNTNSPELIGKTTFIHLDDRLAFSNHMTRCRMENGINPRFIAKQLHFLWMTGYFRHRCKNHVNQASISSDVLATTVPIFLPTRAEQDRISDVLEEMLSDLESGATSLTSALAKLRHYRTSILKSAIDGSLSAEWREKNPSKEIGSSLLKRILAQRRQQWEEAQLRKYKESGKTPPKDWKLKYTEPIRPDASELPALPKGWCWVSAEQVCGFITKGTTPSGVEAPQPTGDVPFIKVQHLSRSGKFLFHESPAFVSKSAHNVFLGRSRVFPEDVLMNIVGPPLGQVSVVPRDFPEWNVNQAIAIFRPILFSNKFLSCCLKSDSIQDRLARRSKTSAGQVNLTLEVCRSISLPMPPLDEQMAIVDLVEDQFSILDHLEADISAKLESAQALRQSILRDAFQGKLVPQDPSDEPATELLKRIAAAREERQGRGKAAGSSKVPGKPSRRVRVKAGS